MIQNQIKNTIIIKITYIYWLSVGLVKLLTVSEKLKQTSSL